MQYDEHSYEETIDLTMLATAALRKWKWLLAALFVGALLSVGYALLSPPKMTVDEEKVTELETALKNNQTTLASNNTELGTAAATMEADEKKITADEELLNTYHADQETLEQTRSALQDSLDGIQEALANSGAITEETASVIVQLPTLINDISNTSSQIQKTAQQIQAAENEIATCQTEITNLTARTETLTQANAGLQETIAGQEEELAALQEGTPEENSVGKAAAIGGILGVLVFCLVIFLQFIVDKKLRSAHELQDRYSLPILGEFYSGEVKNHGKFDRMLDWICGDGQTLPEEQEVYELIAAGIQTGVQTGEQTSVRIAVTGTVEEEMLEEVSGILKTMLPDCYVIEAQINPVYHAVFLAKLREYTVLLVEAKGVSNKEEIAKLMKLLKRTEVPVIGAVIR